MRKRGTNSYCYFAVLLSMLGKLRGREIKKTSKQKLLTNFINDHYKSPHAWCTGENKPCLYIITLPFILVLL